MSADYHALAAFADELAEAARAVTTKYFRTDVDADVKADASPVTIADQETEALIRQKIEATYPDHGIYGEEYGAVRTNAEFVWVLDPIDGTKSFITGKPMFGTLIGLLHAGRPVVGVSTCRRSMSAGLARAAPPRCSTAHRSGLAPVPT